MPRTYTNADTSIFQLEFLRAFIQEITAGVDLFSTTHAHPKLDVPEPTLLKQCRRAVIIVLADIEVLVGKCDQESGGLRLHRLKWVLKSKKISSLLVRSREVRQDMMQACQLMGLHIHQYVEVFCHPSPLFIESPVQSTGPLRP